MNFKGFYTLVDASATHSQLLLRHQGKDAEGTYNMDIVFYGVKQLSIPFTLVDPTIDRRPVSADNPDALEFVFDINTRHGTFSVIASGCQFQRNQLDDTKGLACKHDDPMTLERIQELVEKFDLKAWLESKSNVQSKWTALI